MKKAFTCGYCGALAEQESGTVNRSVRAGSPLYCNRTCAGLARRKHKTKNQLVAEKAEYDRQYRERNREMLKRKKHEYFKRTYDPERAAIVRKARMPIHAEYCRRPEYRKWKAEYDKKYRSRKEFGDFGEAAIILNDLCSEIASRSTFTERAIAKGTLNKHTQRRREYEQQTQRS